MGTEIRTRAPRGPYKVSSPDRSAPIPLGFVRAVQRAKLLRDREPSLSYKALACVMREYHGVDRSASWWRMQLHAAGVPAKRWRGQYGSREAA